MGGQRGDEGTVSINDQSIIITDVVKDGNGRFLHKIKEPGSLKEFSGKAILTSKFPTASKYSVSSHGNSYIALGPARSPWRSCKTRLDHWLKKNRLRFDFSHYEAVSEAQLKEIETIANAKLLLNEEVESYEIPFSEKPEEVVAFFGEKYGENVKGC